MTSVVPGARFSRGRSRSIWLWQLSLAGGVMTISAIGSVLMPDMLSSPLFAVGALSILALTMLTLAAPWRRLDARVVAIVPFVDIVAIGLMGYGGVYRLNYLWIFPIAWIATYYSYRWLVGALSGVAAILTTDIVINGAPPMATQRLVVIVLSLTFLAIVMYSVSNYARALRTLLRRQAARLQSTLTRTQSQAQRTRQMLDSLDVALARVGGRGDILAANDAFIELFALDADDLSLPGRSIEYDAEWGSPLPAPERPLTRAARGELTDGDRMWLFDAEGQWRVVSISTRPLPLAADGPSTALIVQDVSEMYRIEEDRRAIVAAVSHELRNPLTAVLGRTEFLLDRGDLPGRTREQIAIIETAGERMLRLVNENLETALAVPTATAEKTDVDLGPVLTASVESFAPAAERAGIDLRLETDGDLICTADAFRLRQVFDNVVTNAVKYTPADGTVVIGASSDEAAVRVTVTDTGIGIEAEELPRVFEPYFRGQAARDSGIHGTGIGMGIVREIVAGHRGSVTIESEPGRGTVVDITLPRANDVEKEI
jgi:PAS domain S-box-containing protein